MTTQVHTIAVESGQRITTTLKQHAFNLFAEPQENLWTFDLEGRLVGMYVDQENYRRTLDNRFFKKSRELINGEVYRSVDPVPLELAGQLLEQARTMLRQVELKLPQEFDVITGKVLATDIAALEVNAQTFSKIYLPISILPPDQYMALVLQITEGCNYNQCLFCNFYRDRPFRIKTVAEVEQHVAQVKEFFGQGIRLRRSIFLADANALVIPQSRLVSILESIKKAFPNLPDVYSFIDVFTGTKKSAEHFAQLAGLGIRRVYLGVESGNAELLNLLKKPQLTDDILKLTTDIKAGGIDLGLIFLAGSGGRAFHQKHLDDSLELINNIPVGPGDIIYVSEFYETNPEFRETLQDAAIPAPPRREIRAMAREFKQAIKQVVPRNVAVSIYDINQFFY